MALQEQRFSLKGRGVIKNHTFQGIDKVKDILSRMGDSIIVYFDPDVDGVIAGYLVCKFCAKIGKSFEWYINSNRSHDWSLPIESVAGKDIIAVDFIIQKDLIIKLCDAGCNVISMDHHKNSRRLISYMSGCGTGGVVINNQYENEEEDSRYLSGAGVVFETLVAVDPEFDTPLNRQLVGITLLSDVRDIENPLAEGYLYSLYTAKYKGFIRKLIDATVGTDYEFGVPRMDRNFVDYKFSPAVNSSLRFNMQDDVVGFMLGTNELDLEWRERQKELVRELVGGTRVVELNHLRVCFFYEGDFPEYVDVLSNFVGLVANQYLDGSKSVICYMISVKGSGTPYVKRASFRGNISGLNYNSELSGVFICLGHESAFGIKGLVPSRDTFLRVDYICGKVEKDSGYQKKVINVENLSMFINNGAYRIAEDNMYKLSQNRTYIKYTGKAIKVRRSGSKYIEYSINGIPVIGFDSNMNVEDCLILPTISREKLKFYLE